MKGAIEKEELRGRINKILRDEIGRELLDMTADKIIDMLFSENLPNPQEPRVGQICWFWDGDNKMNGLVSVLARIADGRLRYMDQQGEWFEHTEVCRDPLILGRTQAPEGAEWIAPWSQGMWAFFEVRPEACLGGFYLGINSTNLAELAHIFPAPTEGCEPIKLWEE